MQVFTRSIRSPLKIFEKAKKILREEGVRILVFKALGELFYRRLILFERSIMGPVKETHLPKHLSFSILTKAELEEFSAFCPDTGRTEVKRRLGEGQLCFLLRSKGKIVHGAWATTGRAYIEYLSSEFNLRQDVAYIYDSFSSSDNRGRDLPLIRFQCMLKALRTLGCLRVVAAVLPENKAGMRPPLKAGYRPYGTVGFLGVGKWRRTFCRVKKAHERALIHRGTPPNAS